MAYSKAFIRRLQQEYMDTGTPYPLLAERMGCSLSTVARHCAGLLLPKRKLSREDVQAIRRSPASAHELASAYDVHVDTIRNVRSRRTWKDEP